MLATLALLALSAEPPKVAVTAFTCSADVQPVLCEAYERRFTSQLSRGNRVKVVTQRDIGAILGLERQKQLLGCSDESGSCSIELAGALGVDGIMSGSLTQTPGGQWLINMRVIRAADAAPWVTAAEREADEVAMQDKLDEIARRFVEDLQAPSGGIGTARTVSLVIGVAGAAAVIGGSVLLGLARAEANTLKSDVMQTQAEIQSTASRGSTYQSAGGVLLGLGLPVMLVGLALAVFLPSPSGLAFAPVITPHGAWASLSWELP